MEPIDFSWTNKNKGIENIQKGTCIIRILGFGLNKIGLFLSW